MVVKKLARNIRYFNYFVKLGQIRSRILLGHDWNSNRGPKKLIRRFIIKDDLGRWHWYTTDILEEKIKRLKIRRFLAKRAKKTLKESKNNTMPIVVDDVEIDSGPVYDNNNNNQKAAINEANIRPMPKYRNIPELTSAHAREILEALVVSREIVPNPFNDDTHLSKYIMMKYLFHTTDEGANRIQSAVTYASAINENDFSEDGLDNYQMGAYALMCNYLNSKVLVLPPFLVDLIMLDLNKATGKEEEDLLNIIRYNFYGLSKSREYMRKSTSRQFKPEQFKRGYEKDRDFIVILAPYLYFYQNSNVGHWVLFVQVYEGDKWHICLFNSLGYQNDTGAKTRISRYVSGMKKLFTGWRFLNNTYDFDEMQAKSAKFMYTWGAVQKDGSSCGYWVCLMMRYFCGDLPLFADHEIMHRVKKMIQAEILEKRLFNFRRIHAERQERIARNSKFVPIYGSLTKSILGESSVISEAKERLLDLPPFNMTGYRCTTRYSEKMPANGTAHHDPPNMNMVGQYTRLSNRDFNFPVPEGVNEPDSVRYVWNDPTGERRTVVIFTRTNM